MLSGKTLKAFPLKLGKDECKIIKYFLKVPVNAFSQEKKMWGINNWKWGDLITLLLDDVYLAHI